MIDLIKRVSVRAVEANNPVNVLYGTVEKSSPLEIRVHERLLLTEEFLDVSEHLTKHERIVSIEYSYPKRWTGDRLGNGNKESGSVRWGIDLSPSVAYEGYDMDYAKMVYNDGLKLGDKVIIVRMQGGQRYLVLDRYKRGESVWSYR